jgi:Activator of HSP90 ATPase
VTVHFSSLWVTKFSTPLVVCLFSAKCKITEVEKCEGEAVANNRKGKLIFFYEWDIVLKWTGRLKVGENEVEGSISIPNLSEENDISEIDVSF